MITLAPSAREHIIRMLEKKSSVLGIRVGVKGAGCSGFAYVLEYAYCVEKIRHCSRLSAIYSSDRRKEQVLSERNGDAIHP